MRSRQVKLPTPWTPPRRRLTPRALLPALAIAAAALLAFAGSLRNGFACSDLVYITGVEPLLRTPTLDALTTTDYFTASREVLYRPLATLS